VYKDLLKSIVKDDFCEVIALVFNSKEGMLGDIWESHKRLKIAPSASDF